MASKPKKPTALVTAVRLAPSGPCAVIVALASGRMASSTTTPRMTPVVAVAARVRKPEACVVASAPAGVPAQPARIAPRSSAQAPAAGPSFHRTAENGLAPVYLGDRELAPEGWRVRRRPLQPCR